MEHDAQFERIERYLRGKMPAGEAREFEQQLAADPQLTERVELQRLELDSLEFLLEEELRQKFSDWKNDPPLPAAGDPGRSGHRRWQLFLMLAVLLGGAGIWLYQRSARSGPVPEHKAVPPPVSSPEAPVARPQTPIAIKPEVSPATQSAAPQRYGPRQLLALSTGAYTLPPEFESNLRDISGTAPIAADPLNEGIRAFNAGKFSEAIREWENVAPTIGQYELARRWTAHAWYQLGKQNGDFAPAAAIFQSIADKSTDAATRDEAEWYLLLCLLPDYPRHQARADALLRKITDESNHHSYAERAKVIMVALHGS